MVEPVVLCVRAHVSGLNVELTMPDMEDIRDERELIQNKDILEFGFNNSLGEPVDAFVIMENKSAIETTFEVRTQEFQPHRVPTPPKSDNNNNINKQTRGGSGRPLINRMFTSNKTQRSQYQEKNDYKDAILQSEKGLAFVCSPSTGKLLPFETKLITVTAYTDMWGDYHDTLVCQIGESTVKHIPVHIDVVGSPLNIQVSKEQPVMVRFGAHVSGDARVTRNMRINNTSHCDITLDWQTYVVLPHDKQLIDLNVYIGDPYPILDEQGVECVRETEMITTEEGGCVGKLV